MADKINQSKRVRSWYRRAFPVDPMAPRVLRTVSLRAFARGLANMAPGLEGELFGKLRTTPTQAKSVALAWCNDKRVRVRP